MKIAILADIHGNADALVKVLAAAKKFGAERILVAGDLVGYYYEPARVLSLLADWAWTMVRGNHEDMLREARNGNDLVEIRGRYGSGIEAALEGLSKQQIGDLTTQPSVRELNVDGRRILLCHGSPWDPNTYIYPDASEELHERMIAGGHDLVVFGHTHYPVVWSLKDTVIVNPGSVGQPRDRRPGACWASWNTAIGEIRLHRETYDTTAVVEECRRRDPQLPHLADMLTRT